MRNRADFASHPKKGSELQKKLAVSETFFDQKRRVLVARGWALSASAETPLALGTTFGRRLPEPTRGLVREDVWRSNPEYDDRKAGWRLETPIPALCDGEKLVVRLGEPSAGGVELVEPIPEVGPLPKHVPDRTLEADASAPQLGTLTIDDVVAIAEVIARSPSDERGPASQPAVAYFPRFDDIAEYADHRHRARWYLPTTPGLLEAVTFGVDGVRASDAAPAPSHMVVPDGGHAHFREVEDEADYLRALSAARIILVWRPIEPAALEALQSTFAPARVLTVATEDLNAIEYGNYCKVLWNLRTGPERADFLQAEHERFLALAEAISAAPPRAAAVFGTGPSLTQAHDYDFTDVLCIVCNTAIADASLMDHLDPRFVCAGDVVSHFGVSAYAARFREDLARTLRERDIYLLTSAAFGVLLIAQHPEIAEKVICCDQKARGPVLDLTEVWALPQLDSTLNIHMLPLANTFADTVFVVGCDGRDPNPENTEDFWAHAPGAHYHELVETGHLCHPTFDRRRQKITLDRFVDSTETNLSAGERVGKRYFSLTPSFTPALRRRPLPPRLRGTAAEGRSRPASPPPATPSPGRRRILIVTTVNPLFFSGGRYHAFMIGEAAASRGDLVTIWCDSAPVFLGDFATCPAHERVRLHISHFEDPPEDVFDVVFLVPDMGPSASHYVAGLTKAKQDQARTVLLNFETPNWFNSLLPNSKHEADWTYWSRSAQFCDVILSSAAEGASHARTFYERVAPAALHRHAYPSINTSAADIVRSRNLQVEDQIICISRFGESARHKNIDAVVDLIPPEAAGYRLALVIGTARPPTEEERGRLEAGLGERGVTLKLLHAISDIEKFEEIGRSRAMLFPSLFEGYGYPPIEAQYMNTPCVAYDLPVLRESSGEGVFFAPPGDVDAMRARLADILRGERPAGGADLSERIATVASIAAFGDRLDAILEEADRLDRPPAASRFEPANAERVWEEGKAAATTERRVREAKEAAPPSAPAASAATRAAGPTPRGASTPGAMKRFGVRLQAMLTRRAVEKSGAKYFSDNPEEATRVILRTPEIARQLYRRLAEDDAALLNLLRTIAGRENSRALFAQMFTVGADADGAGRLKLAERDALLQAMGRRSPELSIGLAKGDPERVSQLVLRTPEIAGHLYRRLAEDDAALLNLLRTIAGREHRRALFAQMFIADPDADGASRLKPAVGVLSGELLEDADDLTSATALRRALVGRLDPRELLEAGMRRASHEQRASALAAPALREDLAETLAGLLETEAFAGRETRNALFRALARRSGRWREMILALLAHPSVLARFFDNAPDHELGALVTTLLDRRPEALPGLLARDSRAAALLSDVLCAHPDGVSAAVDSLLEHPLVRARWRRGEPLGSGEETRPPPAFPSPGVIAVISYAQSLAPFLSGSDYEKLKNAAAANDYEVALQKNFKKWLLSRVFDSGDVRLMGHSIGFINLNDAHTLIDEVLVNDVYGYEALAPKPHILDVGASNGLFCFSVLKRFPGARVTAVEPLPENISLLRRNLSAFSDGRVSIVEGAVTPGRAPSTNLTVPVDVARWGGLGASIVPRARFASRETGEIEVGAHSLSDLISGPVDLLKMDIEGAEYDVLMENRDALEQVAQIAAELHMDVGHTSERLAELVGMLTEAGFALSFSGPSVGVSREEPRSILLHGKRPAR